MSANSVEQTLVERLRIRAQIRRQIPSRKSVQEGKPDRLAGLLDEAANEIEKLQPSTILSAPIRKQWSQTSDEKHPAIDVIDRLLKEKELRSRAGGYYWYDDYVSIIRYCTVCGAKCANGTEEGEEQDHIVHEAGCKQKEWEDTKPVNDLQLKLLRDHILDGLEIRRMLCIQSHPLAYMDDGEAQDNSELPCIDYLRDSSKDIRDKRMARIVAKKLEGK